MTHLLSHVRLTCGTKNQTKILLANSLYKSLCKNIDKYNLQLISILNIMGFYVPIYCPKHRPFRDMTRSWHLSSFLSEEVLPSKHSSVQPSGCSSGSWSCNLSFSLPFVSSHNEVIIIYSLHVHQKTFSCLSLVSCFFSLKERSKEKNCFLRLKPVEKKIFLFVLAELQTWIGSTSWGTFSLFLKSWSFLIFLLVESSVVKGILPIHLPITKMKSNNFLTRLLISKGTSIARNSVTASHMSCISASLKLITYSAEVLKPPISSHLTQTIQNEYSWCYQGCTAAGRCLYLTWQSLWWLQTLLNSGSKELKSEQKACPLFYYMFREPLKLFPLEVI